MSITKVSNVGLPTPLFWEKYVGKPRTVLSDRSNSRGCYKDREVYDFHFADNCDIIAILENRLLACSKVKIVDNRIYYPTYEIYSPTSDATGKKLFIKE